MKVRIVFNKLLGGWFIVRGPHQTPLGGRFESKQAAEQHLRDEQARRDNRPHVQAVRCEDYPCCGHGPEPYGDGGGCPDSEGRFNCVLCGRKLPKRATSAICARCRNDYSMND
jgi:hypothetical protein